ncbi:MAG: EAL domain-containing protein [Magnetococcales bacterium]|nr:EAL domain-containing protein [Magnetococcales bacterium]
MSYLDTFSFKTKLILILLVPLTGILGLGMVGISEKLDVINKMDHMNHQSKLAVQISDLVHETQRERGLTAGYLGSHGKKFSDERSLQQIQTDKAFQQLTDLTSTTTETWDNWNSNHFIQSTTKAHEEIITLRHRVNRQEVTSEEAIQIYSTINHDLLDKINILSSLSATVEIANLIKNYNTFLQGKERAGLERAVVTNTLASQQFGSGMYRKFSTLISEQETLFDVFRTMASPDDQAYLDEILADPAMNVVSEMRDVIFKSGYASSLYLLLGQLYQNMALRGAYHSIKNLLIRGSLYGFQNEAFDTKQQQRHYKRQFQANYLAIEKIIKQIRALPPSELSPDQRQDVETIWNNILAYHKSVDVIIDLQNQGKHLHEIDQNVSDGIKIDDLPADMAIRRLMESTTVGQFNIDPNDWFKATTTKINLFQGLENHLAGELLNRSTELRDAAWIRFMGYLLFILIILAISLIFGNFLVRQLQNKTNTILTLNEKIVAGDFSVRIPIATNETLDELDRIAASMNIVVEGLEKTTQSNLQAIHDLQVSEARVRSVLNTAPDAILSLNAEGEVQAINPAGENLFGYYPGTLIGQSIGLLIPNFQSAIDQDGKKWSSHWIKNERITYITIETDGLCRDAGHFPVEIALSSYAAEGEDLQFTLIMKDITERKQVKAALTRAYSELEQRVLERTKELEQTNQKLFAEIDERIRAEQGLLLASKVFETATEGILITDADVKIIKVNQAFTDITGYSHDELIGQNPSLLSSKRHDADFYTQMWDGILKNGSWTGEVWNRRKNGEIFPQRLSITSVWNVHNQLSNYVGIFSDITHIKETELRLEKMAYFDALTQLPNRILFKDRLQHEMDKKTRHEFKVAVFFIDLDRFKHVNDSLGHSAGDQLLVEVSERIKLCLRKYDTVARLGGDEFAAIITGLKEGREAAHVAKKIIESLKNVFILNGHEAFIGASIGISVFPTDGEEIETLTKHADIAMYKAKESGRGTFKFFEEEINTGMQNHLLLESGLRNGLKNNEFVVHYQPKVSLTTGRMCGMEALVRWFPAQGPMISPAQFIPLAEETGIILSLGAWVLREACLQAMTWRRQGYPIKMAVNLSVLQFQKNNLVDVVKSILEESELPAEALELEITESMVMGNVEKSIERIKSLKDLGLTLAVDDFGTGYSSLNYLKRFPIDTLKIDQTFVRDLSPAPNDLAIVLAIISLGRALNLNIVAEGVETPEQLAILKEQGCHEMQGYLFSKPLPAHKITELFENHPILGDKS